MKIFKEKFDKLKQLDRIEFRQRCRLIEEMYETGVGFFICKGLIIFFFVFLLFIPQASLVYEEEVFSNLVGGFRNIFTVLLFFALFGFIIDLLIIAFKNKKIRELEMEYFNVEVKK